MEADGWKIDCKDIFDRFDMCRSNEKTLVSLYIV